MNRYVKIEGNSNWFLVLNPNENEPHNLSKMMQEKMLQHEMNYIAEQKIKGRHVVDWVLEIIKKLNYEAIAKKYGTILIKSNGEYKTLGNNNIIEETFNNTFPIDNTTY